MAATASSPAASGGRARALIGYGMAMAGPIGSAAAQFLLSLLLLRSVETAAFGRFSFLLVASQFSWGIWSALFGAPLPLLFNLTDTIARDRAVDSVTIANLIGAIGAFLLFLALGLATHESWSTSLLFAAFAAVALLRWFGRTYAYAASRQVRTMVSDTVYAGLLLAGTIGAWALGVLTVQVASAVMLVAAAAGLLPFGREFLRRQFVDLHLTDLPAYRGIWRQHAGWSLIGVVTTEATANSHAYLVTLLRGPSAFAPVAASALLIRPVMVAINALADFERARMARQLGAGALEPALASRRLFLAALMAIWLVTGIASLVLLTAAPRLVFPPQYSLTFLATGATLWLAVGLIRSLRAPQNVMLQAGGGFRPLAIASLWSAGVSVVGVAIMVMTVGPLWSIAGVALGEAVFALAVWRTSRRWVRAARAQHHATVATV